MLLTVGTGSPKVNLYTFRKRATAADSAGSSYQFDISASTAGTAAISAWSGVDNTAAVSSAGAVANSLSITLPAVTANSLRIGVGAISRNNGFPATCAAGAGCPLRVAVEQRDRRDRVGRLRRLRRRRLDDPDHGDRGTERRPVDLGHGGRHRPERLGR